MAGPRSPVLNLFPSLPFCARPRALLQYDTGSQYQQLAGGKREKGGGGPPLLHGFPWHESFRYRASDRPRVEVMHIEGRLGKEAVKRASQAGQRMVSTTEYSVAGA